MKKDIHPEYYEDAKITCACGATYETGSTKEKISVELCAQCHPFYTGKQKIIDTARRVERFEEMMKKHEEKTKTPSKSSEQSKDKNAEKKTAKKKKTDKDIKEELEKMKKQLNTENEQ